MKRARWGMLLLACGPAVAAGQQAPVVDRHHLPLVVTSDTLAVCRFPVDAPLPAWALEPQPFLTVSRTRTELSIAAPQSLVGDRAECARDYRAVRVSGPLPLDLIGIVAGVAEPLAQAGISLFAISTYETDYVLVKSKDLARATLAWQQAGHSVTTAATEPGRRP